LRKIKELEPAVSVAMITAYGDVDLAAAALKDGASDFIVKPRHNKKLLATLTEVP